MAQSAPTASRTAVERLEPEPRPILQRPSVSVGPLVVEGREELHRKVRVGAVHVDDVESAIPTAGRALRPLALHPRDVRRGPSPWGRRGVRGRSRAGSARRREASSGCSRCAPLRGTAPALRAHRARARHPSSSAAPACRPRPRIEPRSAAPRRSRGRTGRTRCRPRPSHPRPSRRGELPGSTASRCRTPSSGAPDRSGSGASSGRSATGSNRISWFGSTGALSSPCRLSAGR